MKTPKPKLLIEQLYEARSKNERMRVALENIIDLTSAAEMGTAAEVHGTAVASLNQQRPTKGTPDVR